MANIFTDFLQEEGLYQEIEITQENISDLLELIAGNVRMSVYCKECAEMRVFAMKAITHKVPLNGQGMEIRPLAESLQHLIRQQEMCNMPTPGSKREGSEWKWSTFHCLCDTRVMVFPFACAMNETHRLDFVVLTQGNIMRKIGQYPSIADLTFPELDNYKKVISKEDRSELRRAIGLYSQGIGAGSYVYLRRIFERIIEKAKTTAITDGEFTQDDFSRWRMDEKIKALKNHLPEMIVENPTFYGIVSKGIHSLSEDECRAYFPVMQDCIFAILQQWDEKRKKDEANKQLESSLSQIASNIK